MPTQPVCVVVGVGPGNGAAFARRFAKAGYAVALLARQADYTAKLADELPGARAFACDVSYPDAVSSAFAEVRRRMGDPEILIYNAGAGIWGSIEEITPADFETAWRINALGGLLCAQEVIPAMKRRKQGRIVFIGATASRRGGANFAAFAPAKAAQRSLAESMARQLGPKGIHVALLVIDGMVDTPGTREATSDRPESFFIKPADIARTVFHITRQHATAWSFEVEVRPYAEKW
jgi:NAD(P)-dependent dehydrogenase (short-subunit alcohol dehydrogenase family)